MFPQQRFLVQEEAHYIQKKFTTKLRIRYSKYSHCQHGSLCLSFNICDLVLVSDSRQEGQNAKSMRMAWPQGYYLALLVLLLTLLLLLGLPGRWGRGDEPAWCGAGGSQRTTEQQHWSSHISTIPLIIMQGWIFSWEKIFTSAIRYGPLYLPSPAIILFLHTSHS